MSESIKIKATKKRMAVLDVLKKESVPLNVKEIKSKIRNQDMDLSTVYRALSSMVEKGIINKEVGQDKKAYYSFKRKEHCHKIICSKCKKTMTFEFCPIEKYKKSLSNKTGFIITGHSLEFTGICPSCAKNNIKRR